MSTRLNLTQRETERSQAKTLAVCSQFLVETEAFRTEATNKINELTWSVASVKTLLGVTREQLVKARTVALSTVVSSLATVPKTTLHLSADSHIDTPAGKTPPPTFTSTAFALMIPPALASPSHSAARSEKYPVPDKLDGNHNDLRRLTAQIDAKVIANDDRF